MSSMSHSNSQSRKFSRNKRALLLNSWKTKINTPYKWLLFIWITTFCFPKQLSVRISFNPLCYDMSVVFNWVSDAYVKKQIISFYHYFYAWENPITGVIITWGNDLENISPIPEWQFNNRKKGREGGDTTDILLKSYIWVLVCLLFMMWVVKFRKMGGPYLKAGQNGH